MRLRERLTHVLVGTAEVETELVVLRPKGSQYCLPAKKNSARTSGPPRLCESTRSG